MKGFVESNRIWIPVISLLVGAALVGIRKTLVTLAIPRLRVTELEKLPGSFCQIAGNFWPNSPIRLTISAKELVVFSNFLNLTQPYRLPR